jgi:GNAT superfamily N-acetyltransferase
MCKSQRKVPSRLSALTDLVVGRALDNWLAPIVRACLTIRDYLFPVRSMATPTAGKYARTVSVLEPGILDTDRRRQAWYLSLLSVTPKLQGTGLGSLLIREGLRDVDARGRASWLVGLDGTDRFYERHGFREVARANVGELKDWDGGIVMFRE